jgi:hypothetical protein
MKPRHDEEQVTAAVAAAMATLEPAVTDGVFEGRSAFFKVHDRIVRMQRPLLETKLKEVIRQKLQAGEEFPPLLQKWLASYVLAKPKEGRPVKFQERDYAIYRAVGATIRRGFHLASNDATRGAESASLIVSTALANLGIELSEKNIARIWRNFPKSRAH